MNSLSIATKQSIKLGPVVQSIASLTNLLEKDSLSLIVLTKSIAVIFFAEKL